MGPAYNRPAGIDPAEPVLKGIVHRRVEVFEEAWAIYGVLSLNLQTCESEATGSNILAVLPRLEPPRMPINANLAPLKPLGGKAEAQLGSPPLSLAKDGFPCRKMLLQYGAYEISRK